MKKDHNPTSDTAALRRRAEERLKNRLKSQRPEGSERVPGTRRTAEDMPALIQELQIHQIELEMQNEELRKSRVEVETLLIQYTDLYDFAPVGYLTLDSAGAIRRVNLNGARLLGENRYRLRNRRFDLFVSETDRSSFNDFLQKVFNRQAVSDKEICEVALCNKEDRPPSLESSGCRHAAEANRRHVRIEGTVTEDGQECRAVMTDITDRKLAEEKIKASLLEKETMLKEIHHRVSNALKHAFPEGKEGEIKISMTTAGDRFVLKVQDNGNGLPEAVDFQNPQSLGLELVNLLVGQMNGTIDLQVEGGTTFTITFPAVSK